MTANARVGIVVPAYQEGEDVIPILERIAEAVSVPFACLIVVDMLDDPTVKVVERFHKQDERFSVLVNSYGLGPANAIRYGIDHVTVPVAVVTMADGSDDPLLIDGLVRLVERGVVVAAASRYMPGGQQVGGPFVKSVMSRMAGLSLRMLTRVGTRDATNSFKAYSVDFVRSVGIDSRAGFEIGLEMTAKARRLGLPVAELPTIWLDRAGGVSNFRTAEWLPRYLHWYRFAFGRRLTIKEMNALTRTDVTGQPALDD